MARLSIDRSGMGMNLAENLGPDYPQVVGENPTNESKKRWCTDFKMLLQHRYALIGQIHGIKRTRPAVRQGGFRSRPDRAR